VSADPNMTETSPSNVLASKEPGSMYKLMIKNRAAMGTLGVFCIMMLVFFIGNPVVFSTWAIYKSVLISLPIVLFLVVPLVFVVVAGEIDLSFPSTMAFSAWIFALAVTAGVPPFIAMLTGVITGLIVGVMVGAIVVYGGLSSLVATLGLNFLIRGFILIMSEGKSLSLLELRGTFMHKFLASEMLGIPSQMYWAAVFVFVSVMLFNYHRFGAHTRFVGDNPDSAAQMGVNVKKTRVATFAFVGVGAALAGIFSTMINFTWWPTSGDGFLLPGLAAVFVGGTPTWGGIGTITGGALGAVIVSFIQTGIVASGLSGFYVQFFNGLIILLSLIGHRWNQIRYR